jgi:predicted esterase
MPLPTGSARGWRSLVKRADCLLLLYLLAPCGLASAATVILKDGRTIQGKVAPLRGVATTAAEDKKAGPGAAKPIVMIDDELRRYLVPRRELQELREGGEVERLERFVIPQAVAEAGNRIVSVGPIIRITDFDEYGRRIFTMQTANGSLDVIQGITLITPTYTQVNSLKRYIWEQRIATSSIPRETLSKILRKNTDPNKLESRLKIVRFYVQAERYKDARAELEQVLADFPNDHKQLEAPAQSIRQLEARRLLEEMKVYAAGGRHAMAYSILEHFPSDGVAGETLQEVREKLAEYNSIQQQGREVVAELDKQHARIEDQALHKRLEPVLNEIKGELNIHVLGRMAAFRQLADDEALLPNEKLSLAVSGWLIGANSAHRNLSVALSTYEVRDLVREYLNAATKLDRDQIYKSLSSTEGADPETIAKLLAHMRPPLETEEPESSLRYKLSVIGPADDEPIDYHVQLPPEYNSFRRYPAVVTLHGSGTTPDHQLDWWAGAPADDGQPRGQAARQGYIVIAPSWSREHQKEYQYSAREHMAVLNSLRDACRRFSIDTDRVFLSGHSMGGNAAWDIALAHPDLWAGVIPIVALSDKYCARYWENARRLPFYFVAGELDGDLMVRNARDLDRFFTYAGFNLTVAEFQGRGHESFSDEILVLFDWMGRQKRDFFPKKFECVTMRPWDNFFWWVELADMPQKSMIDPETWPPKRGVQEVRVEGNVNANNTLAVTTGAGAVSVWLSPELIDFKQPTRVTVNGAKVSGERFIEPDLLVLLEDVRTRGDRQHPFWARVDTSSRGREVAKGQPRSE